MQFCIKVDRSNSTNTQGNQSENDNIPQEPENPRFAPIIILKFLFCLFNR